jgi:hypothetical protein
VFKRDYEVCFVGLGHLDTPDFQGYPHINTINKEREKEAKRERNAATMLHKRDISKLQKRGHF